MIERVVVLRGASWPILQLAALCALAASCSPTRLSNPDVALADRPSLRDEASVDATTDVRDEALDVVDARAAIDVIDVRDASVDEGAAALDATQDSALDAGALADGAEDADARSSLDVGDVSLASDAIDESDVGDGGEARTIECAPLVPSGPSSGLVLSAGFWPGFRFEVVGATVQLSSVGLQVSTSPPGGTLHATVVRLSGPMDVPDAPDLTGGDVVVRASIDAPSSSAAVVRTANTSATLVPGWYAAVFGTGAFGATVTNATLPSAGGAGCTSLRSVFPFTLRQSDGMLLLQGASPHMFVRVR